MERLYENSVIIQHKECFTIYFDENKLIYIASSASIHREWRLLPYTVGECLLKWNTRPFCCDLRFSSK